MATTMMRIKTTWVERVKTGAAWLDSFMPDWASKINLKKLNMDTWDQCILGQLFGTFWHAPGVKEDLGVYHYMPQKYMDRGFYDDERDIKRAYYLKTIWRQEVKGRLAAKRAMADALKKGTATKQLQPA
jgi:hypothetical protein